MRLGGRVAMVTGAGQGVGRGIALAAALHWADSGRAVVCVRTHDLVVTAAIADGLGGATIP